MQRVPRLARLSPTPLLSGIFLIAPTLAALSTADFRRAVHARQAVDTFWFAENLGVPISFNTCSPEAWNFSTAGAWVDVICTFEFKGGPAAVSVMLSDDAGTWRIANFEVRIPIVDQ